MFRTLQKAVSRTWTGRMIGDKAGSIHDAGGTLAKRGSAEEEAYFRSVRAEQMSQLKERHQARADFHQREADKLSTDAANVREFAGEVDVDGDSSFLQRLEELNMIKEEHEGLVKLHKQVVAEQEEEILKLVQKHANGNKK